MIEKKKVYGCNLKPKPCYVWGSILPCVFSHDFIISTTNRQHDTFCCQKVVMIAVRFFWFQSWKGLGETTTMCKRWIYFSCVWIRKCCDILSIQNAHTWRFHVTEVQYLKCKSQIWMKNKNQLKYYCYRFTISQRFENQ